MTDTLCIFTGRHGRIAIKQDVIEAVVEFDQGAMIVTANDTFQTTVPFDEALRTAFDRSGQ